MNAIVAIHPYRLHGVWVFDDEAVGLVREPFVSGAGEIIDAMTSGMPNADSGFTILFSGQPFPGHQATLEWKRREPSGGDWYFCSALGLEGWLCPALLRYFTVAPANIYAQFKEG